MSRRRSTVFDAAALRLHPNGVRVSTADAIPVSSVFVKNKATHRRKTAKANWIATDAGGDGKVTKRRKIVKDSTKDSNELVGEAVEFPEAEEEQTVRVFKDSRANRRVAFEKDLTFLAAPRVETEGNNNSHLQPSSDFLKCIHHFTSQFYGSTDQLFDSGRQYREEKKEKKKRRLFLEAASKEAESSHGEENSSNIDDSDSKGEEKQENKRGDTKRVVKNKETRKDMYKGLDGSALLCIGMLLQAHVSSSLADQIPEMWEDELNEYSETLGEKKTDYAVEQSNSRGRSVARRPSILETLQDNTDISLTVDADINESGDDDTEEEVSERGSP